MRRYEHGIVAILNLLSGYRLYLRRAVPVEYGIDVARNGCLTIYAVYVFHDNRGKIVVGAGNPDLVYHVAREKAAMAALIAGMEKCPSGWARIEKTRLCKRLVRREMLDELRNRA